MAFASLTAQLRLDTADFSGKLARAGAKVGTFGETLSKNYKEANTWLGRHTLGLKDTARIIQGIVISQAFYAAVGAIRDATSALTQFNEKLDYAKVTYGALFGSADLANDFVKVLQEKSINSIFDYDTLATASKKLLAYGIEYQNLGFIMDGLLNFGAMSGDTAALDRIALAIGQIQTTGYLAATEMRQLANAFVPIYDIVQDTFGLTGEQMKNVGDLRLPAEQVINAIVDYSEAKFGDVADAAMLTITGLKNRIVDTMKVLGSEMMMPLTTAWKSFLKYADSTLQGLRSAFNERGWAGVFESLVPDPAMQSLVRSFLANVHNGIVTIMRLLGSLGPIVGQVMQAFVIAFNIVAPVINNVVTVLAALLNAISQNSVAMGALRVATIIAAGAFVLLKAKALGALVITAVTKAVNGLSKALIVLSTLITKHPILMLLAGLAVALVGVAAASGNANNGLSKLFDTLSGAGGGLTQKDIFKETNKDIEGASSAAEQFNNRLVDGEETAKKLQDGINKAGKEAKKAAGLLSFDEVFKLNEDKDSGSGGGSGLASDIEGLISGLGSLGGALIPEIPDFTEFVDDFTTTLFNDLYASVSRVASGAMTGGLIGALAGFAIGGLITKSMTGALAGAQLGMKIGTAAGAGFATFWGDTYAEIERSLQNIAVGGSIGALLGGLVGFVIGAFATRNIQGALTGAMWGTSIGTVIGGALGGLFDGWQQALAERISQIAAGGAEGMLVGALAGLIIGAFATGNLTGALTGARYGAGLGMVIGGALDGIFGDSETTLTSKIESFMGHIATMSNGALGGTLAGLLIGAIVGQWSGAGALVGARAGAKIGFAAGAVGGLIGSYIESMFGEGESKVSDALGNIMATIGAAAQGAMAGGLAGMLLGAIIGQWSGLGALPGARFGAKIGAAIGGLLGGTYANLGEETQTAISDFFNNLMSDVSAASTGAVIGALAGMILGAIIGAFAGGIGALPGAKLGATIGAALGGLGGLVVNYLNESGIGESIGTWFKELPGKISEGWNNFKTSVSNWWEELKTDASNKWNDIKEGISTKWEEIKTNTSTKWTEIKTNLSTKWEEIKTNASTKWANLKTTIGNKWEEIKTNTSTKWSEIKVALSDKWDEIKTNAGTKWTNLKTTISDKWNEIDGDTGGALTAIKELISTKWDLIKGDVQYRLGLVKSIITGDWESVREDTKQRWSEIKDRISEAWDNIDEATGGKLTELKTTISGWWDELKTSMGTWLEEKVWKPIADFFNLNTFWDRLKGLLDAIKLKISGWWDGIKSLFSADVKVNANVNLSGNQGTMGGHATGGIFNREHIARFAEGNKAEAVIPLENASAMQPFVNAISQGILEGLAPTLVQSNNGASNSLPPMYVGTLVADERGLKQLYKKFELIQIQENARRGIT